MEVQRQYGDQVRFIGVPGLADESAMERFVAETGADAFPHMPDDGTLWERFGVLEHRSYVYINDDGTSRLGEYGGLSDGVETLIDS